VLGQVASAFSTSFLSTYVSNQAKPHFAHLAEQVTPMSQTGIFMSQWVARAAAQGQDIRKAQAQVGQLVVGRLQQQATVLAFHDALLLIAGLTAVGIFLALIVGSPTRHASGPVIME
jgi:hypothetical protein